MSPEDPEYWHNKKKYVVLGFSRCGTTALSRYLHCGHAELAYSPPDEFEQKYPTCRPIFITRDPVDRIWSCYNYFGEFRNMSFEDFLNFKDSSYQNVGCNDVIAQSDYRKYIEPYRKFGAIVYRFEDIISLPTFPKDHRGKNSKPMPEEYRRMTQGRLRDAGIGY